MGGWAYSQKTSQESLIDRDNGSYADTDGIFDKCLCGGRAHIIIQDGPFTKIYECVCQDCGRDRFANDFTDLWSEWNKEMRQGGYAHCIRGILEKHTPRQASNIIRARFRNLEWVINEMPNPKDEPERFREWARQYERKG